MPDRENLLGNLVVGDFFHAVCPNGAFLMCLVVSLTDTTIRGRRLIAEEFLEFDRRTGVTLMGENLAPCTINSVAPLPVDIHNVMLGLERKYRLEHDPERLKLSTAEQDALLFASEHYAANPR